MKKRKESLLLFTIILIFLALRIAFITQKNLWFDEVFSWHLTLGSFRDIVIRTSLDFHPPLYYFVLKVWNSVFGDSVFSMRFLSTLFSTLTILFIYSIAKRVLNPANCMVVLLLFAVNPLNIFYSQEARMSAMNLFLNAGSVYFFLKLLDMKQLWKSYLKQPGIYLYIIFRTLALYTHYFSFFIFIVEIILVIIVPRFQLSSETIGRIGSSPDKPRKSRMAFVARIPYLISFFIIVLLYIPWIPMSLAHITGGQSWRYEQITHSGFQELLNFIKDINLGLYYHYSNLNLVYFITIFLVLLYSASFFLSFPRRKDTISILASFFLVVIPLFLGIIISFKQKIEFYRYLSIIVPYIIIFIVYGVTRLQKNYLVIPILLILMFINVFGLSIQYSFDFKNDNYRPLIKHIESNFRAEDRIYVEPHYMGWSIDYYKKQWNLNLPNPVYIRYGRNEILDSIKVQNPERFWVILDYSAVDTTKYGEYINGLIDNSKIEEINTYFLAPNKVELYRFVRRYY